MLRHRGKLITLSGIDGSGKSTVASRLRKQLVNDCNFVSNQFWCKFGDHPLKYVTQSWFIKSYQESKPISDGPLRYPKALKRFYGRTMLAYHLLQIRVVIRELLRYGRNVICDRYIYDTMVDLQQELGYSAAGAQTALGARWIPQPDCRFLLDLPAQLALSRKPDSRSIGFLEQRRAMYLQLAHDYGLTLVDANQPVDKVMQHMIEEIESKNLCFGSASG